MMPASPDREVVAAFRRNGGKVGGAFGDSDLLLLHHTGAKTGAQYVTPLLYWTVGADTVAVLASNYGAPRHPAWYHNLLAQPEVTVQAGSSVQLMRAEVVDPAERARLWSPLVAMYPTYDDYQAKTERQIPVVVLTP